MNGELGILLYPVLLQSGYCNKILFEMPSRCCNVGYYRHADIVKMANIAQIINVLQAMILTQGDQMITTPTFHVYEMYQLHQNAQVLPCGSHAEIFNIRAP